MCYLDNVFTLGVKYVSRIHFGNNSRTCMVHIFLQPALGAQEIIFTTTSQGE